MLKRYRAKLALNARRYYLIQEVEFKLNQWRDYNDRRYLDEAIKILQNAE